MAILNWASNAVLWAVNKCPLRGYIATIEAQSFLIFENLTCLQTWPDLTHSTAATTLVPSYKNLVYKNVKA